MNSSLHIVSGGESVQRNRSVLPGESGPFKNRTMRDSWPEHCACSTVVGGRWSAEPFSSDNARCVDVIENGGLAVHLSRIIVIRSGPSSNLVTS
jgi:hypothetical protein